MFEAFLEKWYDVYGHLEKQGQSMKSEVAKRQVWNSSTNAAHFHQHSDDNVCISAYTNLVSCCDRFSGVVFRNAR
jgi:hypothetical protein